MTNFVFLKILRLLVRALEHYEVIEYLKLSATTDGEELYLALPYHVSGPSITVILKNEELYLSNAAQTYAVKYKVTPLVYKKALLVHRNNHRVEKWENFPNTTRFYVTITQKGLKLIRKEIENFENNPEIIIGALTDNWIIRQISFTLRQYHRQVEKIKKKEVQIAPGGQIYVY